MSDTKESRYERVTRRSLRANAAIASRVDRPSADHGERAPVAAHDPLPSSTTDVTCWTSSSRCVAITAASRGRRARAAQRRARASTSSDRVGSSSKTSSGLPTSARAKASCCSCPDEQRSARWATISLQLELVGDLVYSLGGRSLSEAVETREEQEVLPAAEPKVERAFLRERDACDASRSSEPASWPATRMFPALAMIVPAMQRKRVVLPDPFGPRIATCSPAEALRSKSVSTTCWPKRWCRASIRGWVARWAQGDADADPRSGA